MQSLLADTPENILKKYSLALADAQRESSDLDVCVVSPIFGKEPFEEMVMLAKIAAKIEPLIEPHPYSSQDLQDEWDPLAHEIRTHGIVV